MHYDVAAPASCEESDIAALPAVRPQDFCAHYADAYCRANLDHHCCYAAPRIYDEQIIRECVDGRKRACASYVQGDSVQAGKIQFDGVKAAQALRRYECQAFRCEAGRDLFEYARDFLTGTQRAGNACGEGIESYVCDENTRCVLDYGVQPRRPSDETAPNCGRALHEGERCHTRRDACAFGLYCEPSVRTEDGHRDYANAMFFDLPGTCVRAKQAGESCARARDDGDHYCASHLCIDGHCAETVQASDLYCREGTSLRWR